MNKIVISGYYGFNNIGDESILKAVIDNLKGKLPEVEIVVLSKNPAQTMQKYNVKAVNRKSLWQIKKSIFCCDLLVSGGGSLLQDVSSKKSILYYLAILWIAKLFRKKVFIYSQGIGPINSKFNRYLTYITLRNIKNIVVRDETSKELLVEIGIKKENIFVTSDPVLRINKVDKKIGETILQNEGFLKEDGRITVGWAIRERNVDSSFVDELCESIEKINDKYNAKSVLIPFHYSEDMQVIMKIKERLGNMVTCIEHKYLTEEMLSIIGNMDLLVGVRLHSIIHAAIMDVPIIGISYDPKVNSFMHSINMKAMCSVYDFKSDFFMDEFQKTLQNKEKIQNTVREEMKKLIERLDKNEELIKELLENGKS
jgi:polysaccharide pyruvyl transferase CsaB